FNALVGHDRAIVTALPGTTRDAIEAVVDLGAWPVRLVDTAGLRESVDPIEQLGVAMTARALAEADVVLACGDSPSSLGEAVAGAAARTAAPVMAVRTKGDLAPPSSDLVPDRYELGAERPVVVSAVTGGGLAELRARLERLVEGNVGDEWRDTPLLTRERHRDRALRGRRVPGGVVGRRSRRAGRRRRRAPARGRDGARVSHWRDRRRRRAGSRFSDVLRGQVRRTRRDTAGHCRTASKASAERLRALRRSPPSRRRRGSPLRRHGDTMRVRASTPRAPPSDWRRNSRIVPATRSRLASCARPQEGRPREIVNAVRAPHDRDRPRCPP